MKGKKIILGITGSIAAYKAAQLCRLLIKDGAEVKVIMTPSATKFISPLTLSTLSKYPVIIDMMNKDTWNNHVELGLWADLFLIAPVTANTIGKMCTGIADNMLLATYLSAKCPVIIAPAMDLDMYRHFTTVNNLETLRQNGIEIIDSEYGELASGLVGQGRMAEPDHIIEYLNYRFNKSEELSHCKILVTAGPTFEALDPVRFIGNRSTGTMGVEIAKRAAEMGAEVTLILGPSSIMLDNKNIDVIRIQSAKEMYKQAQRVIENVDAAFFAAAVADYAPMNYSSAKIKKGAGDMTLTLERTIDIAKTLGEHKRDNQFFFGFALETDNESANAKRKLKSKNFDAIVLNSLNDKGAGFGTNTNQITIISKDGTVIEYEMKSKPKVAADIIDFYIQHKPIT